MTVAAKVNFGTLSLFRLRNAWFHPLEDLSFFHKLLLWVFYITVPWMYSSLFNKPVLRSFVEQVNNNMHVDWPS